MSEEIKCNGHNNNSDKCNGHNNNGSGESKEQCNHEDCKNKEQSKVQFQKDFYNSSVLLLSAGKLVKKYNYALGEVIFSMADILLNDLQMSEGNNNQNNIKQFEPKELSPEIESEINNIINKLNEE
jgi:hypothetical protein